MKKQHIVLFSSAILILLFVLGIYLYKSYQTKKLGFMARENASVFVREYSQTVFIFDLESREMKTHDLPIFPWPYAIVYSPELKTFSKRSLGLIFQTN